MASDGRLTEVTDLAALAGHGWAWKYQDHTGKPSLHLIDVYKRQVPDTCFRAFFSTNPYRKGKSISVSFLPSIILDAASSRQRTS